MRTFKAKVITVLTLVILIWGAVLYLNFSSKKPYNYKNYYVEVKADTDDDENIIDESINKELSLSLLRKTNYDVVGIVEFKDREIYEPIVQAKDNEYYVRKNIEKKYANAGIPFVTCEGNIDSKNVVIYGHSSKLDNIIFTPLMNYVDYNYYVNHKYFNFVTEFGTREYEIFAVLNIDLNDLDDSLEFSYTSWDSCSSFNNFIEDTLNNSLYKTGVSIDDDDYLITLVTCDTRDNNKRMVVIAKRIS